MGGTTAEVIAAQRRTIDLSTNDRFGIASRDRLFNHLVGGVEKLGRYLDPERPGRLEVDHKLQLGWKLNWQVARLAALQDAIDEIGGASVVLRDIDAIADQPALFDVL